MTQHMFRLLLTVALRAAELPRAQRSDYDREFGFMFEDKMTDSSADTD